MEPNLSPDEVIEDEETLRSLYAPARYLPVLDQLDRTCRLFIAHSPLVIIASTREGNGIDVSPRGDAPGFVRVLDDNTLVIPDRTGNNRLDTMGNLLLNSEVGLFFVIPGITESLRIKGNAQISRDPAMLAASADHGKAPRVVLVVTVREAFIHCGKALIRSKVWQPDYRADAKAWALARATLENSESCEISLLERSGAPS